MKQLFECLVNDIWDYSVLKEEAYIDAENMINESFKCELLSNLAAQIKKAEAKNNANKKKEREDNEARGYSKGFGPKDVTFASIFGPLTINQRWGDPKKGIQGIRWSELTDDDFTLVKAGSEKELKKALKPIYAKNGKGDAIICLPGTKTPVMFIKGYGKDDDKRLYYFDMDQTHWNSGVKEKTATKYSYQTRSLKLDEVMPLITDLDVYILNITDDIIKKYQSLHTDRMESQKGVVNYDKNSLATLLKQQQARYKTMVAEIKAKKLQQDPNVLFDEIKATNDEVVALYKEIMSNPENLDKYFDMGRLMTYVSYAYESFYKSMKESREADKTEQKYPELKRAGDSWSRARAKSEINDAKEYVDKVRSLIADIKKEL